MAEYRFQVAGLGVRIAAIPEVVDTLKAIYERFPEPASDMAHIEIEWEGERADWATTGKQSGLVRLLDPSYRPQVTTILIARLLAESRPDLFLLHGNALLDPASGRLLFLLGDSGAGKTTLTSQLLDAHPRWRVLAEDTIVIDGLAGHALPFPRAAALRGANAESGIQWGPIGAPGPAKRLEAPAAGRLATAQQPLTGTRIVLLERTVARAADPSPAGAEEPEVTWTTCGDEKLAQALRAAGLPLDSLRTADGVACLRFQRSLGTDERLRMEEVLEEAGALALHTERIGQTRAWRAERPAQPQFEALTGSEGIRQTLRHLRRQSARQATEAPGRTFLRLASALGECDFFRLVPGGSPEQTGDAMERGFLS